MTEFIRFFLDFLGSIWNFLNSMTFNVFGIPISWGAVLFVFLVIGFVVSALWKGART